MQSNVYFTFKDGIFTAIIKYLRPGTNSQIGEARFTWDASNLKWDLTSFQTSDMPLQGNSIKLLNDLKEAIRSNKILLTTLKGTPAFTNFVTDVLT